MKISNNATFNMPYSIMIFIWEALVAMATTVCEQSVPKVSHSKWDLHLFY